MSEWIRRGAFLGGVLIIIGVIAAVKIGGWEDQPFPWVAEEQTAPAPQRPAAPYAPRAPQFTNCTMAEMRLDGLMEDLAAGKDVPFNWLDQAKGDVSHYCHDAPAYEEQP